MPTRLPNGLLIFNATPHDLNFHNRIWQPETVVVKPDRVINAFSRSDPLFQKEGIFYMTMAFEQMDEALGVIEQARKDYPDVLIVGSVIAAQAYKGEVLAPIFWRMGRHMKDKLVRPDRFTIYPKEEQ